MNRLIIFFIIQMSIAGFITAQENTSIHLDKPYYVPGEIIWYNMYLPNEFAEVEATFKIIIADDQGKKVDSYFVNNSGNQLGGHYRIPYGTESGYYGMTVAALDQNDLNQDLLVQFSIPIYNDLEGVEEVEGANFQNTANSTDQSINIRVSKTQYAPGEDVQIGIVSDEKITNYSISVVDAGLLGESLTSNSIQSKSIDLSQLSAAQYKKGIYIQGQTTTKEGAPKKMNQLGVYDGASNEMHLARSNTEGIFSLSLPETQGDKSYQFAGYVSNEAQELNVDLNPDQTPAQSNELVVTSEVANYLQASKIRKKIYQYYETLEYDLPRIVEKVSKKEVKADKNYDMSKYVQFTSVGNFFDEIISSPLQFEILEDGKVKALMYDAEGFKRFNSLGTPENFIFDPIFIVNGKLTRDATYIYSLPLDEVESVDLYTSRKNLAKLVGNFRNYGIAIINAKNPNLTVPINDEKGIKDINAIQPAESFENLKSLSVDMPQLRSLVYWNQNISDGTGIAKPLVFKGSDDVSTFQVTVVARTESGKVISGSNTYTTSLLKG